MNVGITLGQLREIEDGKPVCYMVFSSITGKNVDVVFDHRRLTVYTNDSAKSFFLIVPLKR